MNKKEIAMQKAQNVIKIAIIFLAFHYSSYGQNRLEGKYSRLAILQEHYAYYIFDENNGFEYHSGASLGDDYYGEGVYEIISNNLILNYNKTKPIQTGYHNQEIWTNNHDSLTLNIKVLDFNKTPIPNVNIIYKSSLSSHGLNGIIVNKKGIAILKFKKELKDIDLAFSNLGFKEYKVSLLKKYNYNLTVFLEEVGSGGVPIINQIDTLKILELKNDYFRTIDKNNEITFWKKHNP